MSDSLSVSVVLWVSGDDQQNQHKVVWEMTACTKSVYAALYGTAEGYVS